jgi:hypothetical protein
MTEESVIISDKLRVPVTAERRSDGGVAIRGHFRGILALSEAELGRLIAFATNRPHHPALPDGARLNGPRSRADGRLTPAVGKWTPLSGTLIFRNR